MGKTKVFISAPSEMLKDKEATVACPKYGFGQVQISTICGGCSFYKGIEVARDMRTGSNVGTRGVVWHNAHAVACAYPLQRRIHAIQKVVK